MSPRIGALFAGYGGLELASRIVWPDADLAWVSEFDAAPSRILAHHWPTVPNLGDVTRIDWSATEPVDVLTGGSPCQDLSAAGKRAGMTAGTRSNLWESMREGIAVLRPSLVIWENVRGALSARAASEVEREPGRLGNGRRRPALRALGRVLGDLASLGYDAAWTGIRAADVGAPHGRWRVFVVAWPQGDGSALTWPQGDGSALTWPQGDGSALLPTPAVNDMGAAYTPDEWDRWTDRMKAEHANGNGHGASLHIEALRMLPTPEASDGTGGRISTDLGGTRDSGAKRAVTLATAVHHALLPTPTVSDTNGPGAHGDGGTDLRTAVSLLPTPAASDGDRTSGAYPRGNPTLNGALLPTPTTRDGKGRNQRDDESCLTGALLPALRVAHDGPDCGEPSRADVFNGVWCRCERSTSDDLSLLPTPTTTQRGADANRETRDGAGPNLHNAVADFGIYAPAIARWEAVLGRPAPAPTEPTGTGGAQRLSPRFVEFMQGLPAGWVTDVPGITRNDALKALGNGVVPQQAAEALRWLVTTINLTRSAA